MAAIVPARVVCPLHELIGKELDRVRLTQDGRDCENHDARIVALERSDSKQWEDINALKKTVWSGAGIASVVGSIIGTSIAAFGAYLALTKHFLK